MLAQQAPAGSVVAAACGATAMAAVSSSWLRIYSPTGIASTPMANTSRQPQASIAAAGSSPLNMLTTKVPASTPVPG